MYRHVKIRNIKLVPGDDEDYLRHVEQRVLRGMRIPRLVKLISKADKLSRVVEPVIRAWVAPVGGTDKRIISFETFQHRINRYKQHYRELDLVIDRGNHWVIGELKVSYSSKSRMKAHRQLAQVYQLLSRMDKAIHLLLIQINLLPKKGQPPLEEFHPDFRQCKPHRQPLCCFITPNRCLSIRPNSC